MAYEKPITIKKAIENIKKKKYVLPSIQREFVWDTQQIERLFDSLMRDYPISTFLFWKVEKDKIKDFQFYEFLQHYHEKNAKHNAKAELDGEQDIIALLDGQQRMTSIYISLCGTYAKKIPYHKWSSEDAFPKKVLYLNLLRKADDIEMEFDFKFLTKEEVINDENNFWFEVNQIMELSDMGKVSKFISRNNLMDSSKYDEPKRDFAIDTITQFFNVIHQKETINFFLEESEELDKVLQIFIRINSGGTKLSYSDLLLSIATAEWKEKDAREVIHEFVDDINRLGKGFAFNKDFVLKACLVLADFKDIKFKVDNFTKENMSKIEQNWEDVSSAVKRAVELVAKFGYSRDNLLATNAVIPIAYFIYKNDFNSTILHVSAREEDRKLIKEWLARVLLKGTFGGTPDGIYPVMRNFTNEHLGRFPLKEIIAHYKGKRKSISFTNDDIDNILELKYGKARTYCALTLLYPGLNYNFKYHQDHIHPKSFFTRTKLLALGIIDPIKQQRFIENFNKLPNLQLLEATQNVEKNGKHFIQWLEENYVNNEDKKTFLLQHHINSTSSLSFEDFMSFYNSRKDQLKTKLVTILNVNLKEMVEA